VRLNDALIANERYRGEPTTDEEGRTQWPLCVLWDDDLQGFGVRIFPPVRGKPSRKDFIVTWKVGLKSRTMAIGTHGVDCTLRQARRTAREALDLARRGQDPIEARQRALGIGTAEDLASRFLFEHTAAKKKPAVVPAPPDAGVEVTAAGAPEAEATPAAAVPVAAGTSAAEAPPEVPAGSPGEGVPVPASASPAAPVMAPSTDAVASNAPPPPIAIDDAHRRTIPAPPAPSATKRGPTKVRLLPVPDSLYRTIEHGARESGMTVAAYLSALIEIARAAVGEDAGEHAAAGGSSAPTNENGPSIRELFAQVQEAQAVEVGKSSAAGGDSDQDEPSD
jgi:hypothetical protein